MTEANPPDRNHNARRRSLFDPIGRIVDSVVPSVVGAVDVDDVVSRIDVDELIGRVDIDALMARIDVDALMARIDIDAFLAKVDVDALMARIDVDALMARVDVDAILGRIVVNDLLDRIDVDHLIDRIDVDRIVQRVDINGLMGRVDLDAIMARIDIDAIVDRIDIDEIVQRADLAGIVAQSTRGITASTIDLVRRQITGLDTIVTRVAARVVRRDPDVDPTSPPALLEEASPQPRRGGPSISGHYAGPIARLAAFSIDWFTLVFLFGVATAITGWMINLLFRGNGSDIKLDSLWSAIVFVVWAYVYFAVPLALTGKTFGKAVVGLRVVRRDGKPLRPGQAAVRVLVLPFSIILLGLGLIGGVIGRERRTLHDVSAKSTEVTDWGDRPAAIPSPLNRWLDHRQGSKASAQPVSVESAPEGAATAEPATEQTATEQPATEAVAHDD